MAVFMDKKTLTAVVAAILIVCAVSAIALVRCADAEESTDISTEISEPSDVDESAVSEPSDASEAEESLADPSEPSESSVEDVSKAPEETSTPAETSKVEEPSQPDEPSEPKDTSTTPSEVVKPNEESKVEETSKEEEKEVIHGDTPVEIVVDGKEHTVETYEEAKTLLTLEDFDSAEKGYVIVLEVRGVKLTFVANGDGTFVNTETGRNRSAQQVYDSYISQWCSYCGKRAGDGTNGTCVRKLIDVDCSRCGEFCKMLECHTCDE